MGFPVRGATDTTSGVGIMSGMHYSYSKTIRQEVACEFTKWVNYPHWLWNFYIHTSKYWILFQDNGYSKQIDDPCGIRENQLNLTSSYLWQKPCVQGDFAKSMFGESIPGNTQGIITDIIYNPVGKIVKKTGW